MRLKNICPHIIIEQAAPNAATSGLSIGQIAPAIIAASMLAIGWLVVERYARRRENRSDLRNAVSSFAESVAEVRDAAFAFYRLPGNDPQATSLAATIRSKIMGLADLLSIMKAGGLEVDTDELLKRFRQSVTGGEFESWSRQPFAGNSVAFDRISADAETLNSEVRIAMLRLLLNVSRHKKVKSGNSATHRVPLSQPNEAK